MPDLLATAMRASFALQPETSIRVVGRYVWAKAVEGLFGVSTYSSFTQFRLYQWAATFDPTRAASL